MLVLDAVDATAVGSVVQKANEEEVPVVSYDRLILGAPIDYYISFDNEHVGELQAETLLGKAQRRRQPERPDRDDQRRARPTPTPASSRPGAHKVFEKEGVKIAKEYDTPEWSPDKAQNEMEQAITALGKNGFAGVYAANDGTAGGAIAAMKSAGIEPASKPTTGQDAELEAIQRILVGEQFMTVYKAIKPEANAAAEIAVALAEGEEIPVRPGQRQGRTTKPKRCHRCCSNRWRSPRTTSTKRSSRTNSGPHRKSAPARTRPPAKKPASNSHAAGAGRRVRPAPAASSTLGIG